MSYLNRFGGVGKRSMLLFCFLLVLAAAAPSLGSQRVALVIGNSAYDNVPLKNPVNDATDIGAALNRLNFDVDIQTNVNKRKMLDAIYRFANKLKRADIGFFFYAGHGVQIRGANYLIPVGTDVKSSGDIEYEAVHAGRILSKMEEAGNSLNMVVLDACRNNPFRGVFRSTGRGLAKMDAPVGSIIAYATSPGSVAHDGSARNGIFTKHLLKAIERRDLTVRDIFDKAGLGVMKETKRAQVPWVHSSPMEPIYLARGNPEDTVVVNDAPVTAVVVNDAQVTRNSTSVTGSLKVTSEPSGAQIQLNGEASGKTPLQLGNIPVGAMRVAVVKNGFTGEEQKVKVKAGRRAVVHFDLEKEANSGWLTVRTSPSEARVRVLNISPAYRSGMELEAGRYHIEVSASGYTSGKRWIDLAVGDDMIVEFSLGREQVAAVKPKPQPVSSPGSSTDPTTGMEFVRVPGGCFQMGGNSGDSDEKPVHEVCVDSYSIGKYEVTQGEYQKIKGSNPSEFKKGDRFPVEKVSWDDAQKFIKKLNRKSGKIFRLPTEAEWEYAARSGGKTEKYSGGTNVDEVAWHGANSGETTHRVGTKRVNGLGIYDMSGNVWEWCQDRYGKNYYSSSPKKNPVGPGAGLYRVIRGGGWGGGVADVRSAGRYRRYPSLRYSNRGFRLVLSPQEAVRE